MQSRRRAGGVRRVALDASPAEMVAAGVAAPAMPRPPAMPRRPSLLAQRRVMTTQCRACHRLASRPTPIWPMTLPLPMAGKRVMTMMTRCSARHRLVSSRMPIWTGIPARRQRRIMSRSDRTVSATPTAAGPGARAPVAHHGAAGVLARQCTCVCVALLARSLSVCGQNANKGDGMRAEAPRGRAGSAAVRNGHFPPLIIMPLTYI